MNLKKDLTSFIKKHKNPLSDPKGCLPSSVSGKRTPLIVVLGPTASGKTALSLKIAHLINGEIISTDSRQIYKEMEIGTDAIPEEKRENIPHHLIGITTPDKTVTSAEFKDMALKEIKQIRKRKHIPMLVGGTGLYISSIIDNYDMPHVEPDKILRAKLQKLSEKYGNEYVYKKLKKIDPLSAKKIHPNNLRYVIRAIEINLKTNKNKSDKKKKPSFDIFMVGVSWPRELLYERVNLRADLQIKRGLVEEVKALLKKGYKETLPSMSSLGVKEIIPYIKGKMTLEKCLEILKQNTRRYAKRQMTWFRRYDNVNRLTPEELKKFIK